MNTSNKGKMIENNIRMEDHTTYTNVPWPLLDRIEKWLNREKIEYKVLKQSEIPPELPQGLTFLGRTTYRHVGCIQSKMNSEDFMKVCEKLFYVTDKEI